MQYPKCKKRHEEKEEHEYTRIIKWDEIKDNFPATLKVSPLAMSPHKSRKFRAILYLSFVLKVFSLNMSSVKAETMQLSPPEAIDQIGSVLPRIIEAIANADQDKGDILFTKLDIKDGYWRMVVKEGAE